MGTNCWSLQALNDPCTRRGFWSGGNDLSYGQGSFEVNFNKMSRNTREIQKMGQNNKNKHFF